MPQCRHGAVLIPPSGMATKRLMIGILLASLLTLMNASRAQANVPPLSDDPMLRQRAQVRAERMCAAGQFSHDGYQKAFAGLGYRSMAENLAKGQRDARSVHSQLMASPGHRANILNGRYRAVGIGSACNITVELFGGK